MSDKLSDKLREIERKHIQNDVPWLLDQIKVKGREIKKLNKAVYRKSVELEAREREHEHDTNSLMQDRKDLYCENERLREALNDAIYDLPTILRPKYIRVLKGGEGE